MFFLGVCIFLDGVESSFVGVSAVCFLVNLERETAVCCLEVGDYILNISISSKKESPSRMMSPPWLRGSCPTRGESIVVEAERSGCRISACTGRKGCGLELEREEQ